MPDTQKFGLRRATPVDPALKQSGASRPKHGALGHARRASESNLLALGDHLRGVLERSKTSGAAFVRKASLKARRKSLHRAHSDADKQIYRVYSMPEDEKKRMKEEEEDGQVITVPALLQQGTPMLKVSEKKIKTRSFQLDPDQGTINWESKKSGIIALEDIKEIRSGADARYYREQFKMAEDAESRWLSIIYIVDSKYKTLHLVALTDDVFRMWDTTLRALHAIRQDLMSGLGHGEARKRVWERRYWKGADDDKNGKLEFDDVERMCNRLNINLPTHELKTKFASADSKKQGSLDFPDFQQFVKMLKTRPEIGRLYNRTRSSQPFDYGVFAQFMRETQKSASSAEELRATFEKYADGEDKSNMSVDAFTTFLMSTENSSFADSNGKVVHDMNLPVSNYYISSSHNTYLVGHQLVGLSTIEGYIRALIQGCRSVELDIYDGDSEPVIYHGRTFTNKVPLRDICQAIHKYAFMSSPYPIVISAEVHCSLPQQDLIAKIMRQEFGDALVCAPVEDGKPIKSEPIQSLPSPEELRGRVLLKAKNLYVAENVEMQQKNMTVDTESSTSETSDDAEPIQELKSDLKKAANFVRRRKSTASNSDGKPKVKMSFELLALLVYTVGVKCRGINKKETYAPEHVFSLSERTANKVLKQDSGWLDLVKHNRTHVTRIYPNGTRVASTNYEPHRYWAAGAQLVAINWQTIDLGYMINHAMFQRNGRCGYVLKPPALREDGEKKELLTRTKHFLDVTIMSAQQLPRRKDETGREIVRGSAVDPYIQVSLHIPEWTSAPFLPSEDGASPDYSPPTGGAAGVVPSSARTVSFKTGVVKNNGFNPVWEEALAIPFDLVGDMRDLVFVKFLVKDERDDDDEFLAVHCVSLGSLQQGYRHIPLHDSQLSQFLFSTLFVHIGIRDA